jgi:hypothetical protein
MPSMANVLAYPGFWAKEPDTGIDWVKILHAGQEMIMHKPLPASGTVEATTRINEIIDKGEGKGALILSGRTVRDTATGEDLCTLISTTMARGDGRQWPLRSPILFPSESPMWSVICLPWRRPH